MAASDKGAGSLLALDEYFVAGDDRFLDELRLCRHEKKLLALGERWYRDARPMARGWLLSWIEEGCALAPQRALVKRVFKLAEQAGDDEAMGHFMVAFDFLWHRALKERTRWNFTTRSIEVTIALEAVRVKEGFSARTRRYLSRRAFRYFRTLARKDPKRFGPAIRAALAHYPDEHLEKPEWLLDSWGLLHTLYWGSPVLVRRPSGIRLAEGRDLAELAPAPIHPETWRGCFDEVFALLLRARGRTVRQFALRWMREQYADDLRGLSVARVRPLLASAHEELQRFGAEVLESARGLDALPVSEWLELLAVDNTEAVLLVCRLFEKHVAPSRLSLAAAVDLARGPVAPVAALGLRAARAKAITTVEDFRRVLTLASAPVDPVRAEATRWIVELAVATGLDRAEDVRDLADSRFADVRAAGCALIASEARFSGETSLWAALAESPYDDVRAFLVGHLKEQERALTPESLLHLWATSLLAIHRGGRTKRIACGQIADRIVRRPSEADALLPLLGVSLRGLRAAERANALGAISRAAFRAPSLREAIARRLPDLRLFPEGVA